MSDKTRRSTTMMRDWRKSLGGSSVSGGGSAGVYHRIGHPVATLRFLYQYALIAACCCMLFVVFLYMKPAAYETSSSSAQSATSPVSSGAIVADPSTLIYNSTYPLTRPVRSGPSSTGFRIALIADLDQQSRVAGAKADTWRSYMKYGNLLWSAATRSLTVQWDTAEPAELRHQFALKGRGMELSELVTFNGRLLTVDDRTGLVYEVRQTNGRADGVVPWVVLMDGDGRGSTQKGFKSEWATVKDEQLWVGSMGKEWTTALGQFESFDPMWVKVVTAGGQVHHLNWVENYKRVREAIGIKWPGYMIHETVLWSPVRRRWYFLPRRCSRDKYNETADEHNGCNQLISADENFDSVRAVQLQGEFRPTHGFSSAKFVPGTDDRVLVVLLSEEVAGETATYVAAFDVDGKVVMPQQQVPTKLKYEGVEFI